MESVIEITSGPYIGGAGNDTYVADPDTLGDASITDQGGIDTLIVYDRPGRTAGEFEVIGDDLFWRDFDGDTVQMDLNADGSSQIEFFEWERLAEDGNPYTMRSRIITDLDNITGSKFVVAGTEGDDNIVAPTLTRQRGDWSEVYGNEGDDRLVGSNKHLVILYGGDGNDALIGKGRQDDDMLGDAGNDVLRGHKGDDNLDGGAGNDRIFGGAGNDAIRGGTGNDLLKGQGGEDQFIFNADEGNEGRDTIFGFTLGTDTIVMEDYSDGRLTFAQGDGGALVTLLETGTKVFLVGLTAQQVADNDESIFIIG